MGFVIVPRGTAGFSEPPLKPGQIRLGADGKGTFCKADAAKAGIGELAVVLADAGTLRIALRAAAESERDVAARVSPVVTSKKQPTDRVAVSLMRAIRAIGVTSTDVKGRHELLMHGKAGDKCELLVVCLLPNTNGKGQK